MKKIVLNLCSTLDGYIEGSNGEIDWCFTDQDYCMTDFLNSIDTIFIGRKSYVQLEELMPNSFPDKKKIVFSKTLKNSDNLQVINDNIEEEVNKIVKSSGKNIWLFGGAILLSEMLNLNLVDEIIISIHPLILGKGKSLVSNLIKEKKLQLVDTKTFDTGLIQAYYKVVK